MSASQKPPSQSSRKGRVKQVLSGDTVIIQGYSKPNPPEMTFCFVSVTAPKLAKRVPAQNIDTPDEPFAWEAREFLRKKLIKQPVTCIVENNMGAGAAAQGGTQRVYGTLFFGPKDEENITETMLREGYLKVRSNASPHLVELQDQAKSAHKGLWADNDPTSHVRDIKWTVDNLMNFVDKCEGKPIDAVIEHVRDGSTVKALLLPDFVYITLMMSGIKCPSKDGFADEARRLTESLLLQQDVKIILESTNNNNFVGVVHHPCGNIAEELVSKGLAHCVDWSIAKMKKSEADKLRTAERNAKQQRLRIWKDWTPPPKINDREYVATVVEVVNGDALMVRQANGTVKKIFLAGIRPPKDQTAVPAEENKTQDAPNKPRKRNLYDIPWMFEAREFLRKKLIGKKVNVTVDYIQPARESLPEKYCCTVTIANVNVAEALVSKGLATAVRYRQNDEQRASAHDALLAAELKAQKGNKGVHAKKDIPIHRVNDVSGDPVRAKSLYGLLPKSSRVEALVEFVTNSAKLRLYLPKDSHLITFWLNGIEVKFSPGDPVNNEEAALQFTKDKCMQKEVEIQIEGTDKKGNFFGWLWVDNINLSVALVEAGLAKIHYTGENSKYARDFQNAMNSAKSKGLWKYAEKEETAEVIEDDKIIDRKIDYKEVLVVETNGIDFYCQFVSEGQNLNMLQAKLAAEMEAHPPLPGAYTPKRGDTCAARYAVDGNWYRAKIEKIQGTRISVFYIDYGNRADISSVDCATLPSSFGERPFAHLYSLAFVALPSDEEDKAAASQQFRELVQDRTLLLNYEYSDKSSGNFATLYFPSDKEDVGKSLVTDGFVLVVRRREKRLEKVMAEYEGEQNQAQKKRYGMWQYGDVREDDDREFGMGR